MPELPDVTVYVEHLARHLVGAELMGVTVASPNLLRTAEPPLEAAFGRHVTGVRRAEKRIVIDLEGDLHLVVHLMISGRLHWLDPEAEAAKAAAQEARNVARRAKATAAPGPYLMPIPRRLPKNVLAEFRFANGLLTLTEASTRQRASLWVLQGEDAVRALDRGGIEPLECVIGQLAAAMRVENHTLKRSLTDQRLVSGIGNAYSDEILHRARLSPLLLTSRLDDESLRRLYDAMRDVLFEWVERLRAHYGDTFPEKVTAFRPEMAVHGKFKEPCPVCGSPVQRIVYADNETNYCATCQTGGRLLADRALSRLLKDDWPRTLEAMEE